MERWKEEKTQRLFVLPPCIPSTIGVLGGGLLDGERMGRASSQHSPDQYKTATPGPLLAKWKSSKQSTLKDITLIDALNIRPDNYKMLLGRLFLTKNSLRYLLWHTTNSKISDKVLVEKSLLDSLYRINSFQTRIIKEAKSRNAKYGVEDVNHISWPVCNAASLRILAMLVIRPSVSKKY